MRFPLCIALFLACATRLAQGYYVIPYELRPNGPGTTEVYTVLVILGDHYDHHFGEQDGLTNLLAKSYHAPKDTFAADYLTIPQNWYLDQVALANRIYGPNAKLIAADLRTFEPIAAGRTSAVVITEHLKPEKVLAFLRVDVAGPDGRLSSERHFLEKGLKSPFDMPVQDFNWRKVADFQAHAHVENFHALPPADRLHYWLEGENAELKNYALNPTLARKLFKHGYQIARAHKLFTWGSGVFPKKFTHWPNDGSPIPPAAYERFGVRISHLWLDAYSDLLLRHYGAMELEQWDHLNNEYTYFRDLFFLKGSARNVEARLGEMAEGNPSDLPPWLVYDPGLDASIKMNGCKPIQQAVDALDLAV